VRRPADPFAWLALIAVYLAWGATYVAIRVAVRDMPALLVAGSRFLVAGALLWPIAQRFGPAEVRRADRMGLREWASCALVGLLLLVLGNGGVTVAERTVPAGTAALLVATVPLWMAVFARFLFGDRIGLAGTLGLFTGIVGVLVIVRPGGGGHAAGLAITLCAAAAWGLGSVLTRRLPLPRRPLAASAAEMITGGVVLLVGAAAAGDYAVSHWSAAATGAMVFLVFVGSMLGFTCYAYALARLPGPVVATYAYVNPVVAVLLGWVLLGERLSWTTAGGAAFVVASVVLTVSGRRPPAPETRPSPAQAPDYPLSRPSR
jgi:drug/metabolite transporter (DMT)-like permease